jgi:hypothetical protein
LIESNRSLDCFCDDFFTIFAAPVFSFTFSFVPTLGASSEAVS